MHSPKQQKTDRELEEGLLVFWALVLVAALALTALLAALSLIVKVDG